MLVAAAAAVSAGVSLVFVVLALEMEAAASATVSMTFAGIPSGGGCDVIHGCVSTGYATSGTANTIDNAADATASVSETNTTDTPRPH
eukprot:g14059.t1